MDFMEEFYWELKILGRLAGVAAGAKDTCSTHQPEGWGTIARNTPAFCGLPSQFHCAYHQRGHRALFGEP